MIRGSDNENRFWTGERKMVYYLVTIIERIRVLSSRCESIHSIIFIPFLACIFNAVYKGLIIAGPGGGIGLFCGPTVIRGLVCVLGFSLAINHHQPLFLSLLCL